MNKKKNEKITRYQHTHILPKAGSAKQYQKHGNNIFRHTNDHNYLFSYLLKMLVLKENRKNLKVFIHQKERKWEKRGVSRDWTREMGRR